MKKVYFTFAGIFILALLAVPVVVYVHKFGYVLSTEHVRWGEFGAFLSGAYAPLFALLTLYFLFRQNQIQSFWNRTNHTAQFLERASVEADFYIQKLTEFLGKEDSTGVTARELLIKNFGSLSAEALRNPEFHVSGKIFYDDFSEVISCWGGLYSEITGIAAQQTLEFQRVKQQRINKAVALYSFKLCVALDNAHFLYSKGSFGIEYFFSPLIPKLKT